VARLFAVYGPGEHDGRLLPSLQRLARTGGRIGLTAGHQRRDFTYVEDAVEGLLRLAVSPVPPGTVVNVATGTLTSVRDFALTAAALLRLDPAALDFGALPTRPEEMVHDVVDVTRLEALTGWRPRTSVADGLRQSLERAHVRR
jgi:GDP-4-dehydro-6-deoxy-D-mannose reductase